MATSGGLTRLLDQEVGDGGVMVLQGGSGRPQAACAGEARSK